MHKLRGGGRVSHILMPPFTRTHEGAAYALGYEPDASRGSE